MLKKISPGVLIGVWVASIVTINIITIPTLFKNTSGGEQRPISFLLNSAAIAIYGIFVLEILMLIVNHRWFLKYLPINVIFLLIPGVYILNDRVSAKQIPYGFSEQSDSINNAEILTKVEYYDMQAGTVRSRSYWRNGKKDSTWITYSKYGDVIKIQHYKNDKLVDR